MLHALNCWGDVLPNVVDPVVFSLLVHALHTLPGEDEKYFAEFWCAAGIH